MKALQPENWDSQKKILVILAHPDDPEFFCGATLARWSDAGHVVNYLLLTSGDKGSDDPLMTPGELITIRQKEQREAGNVIGVNQITFLGYPDGFVIPDISMRKELVRHIRRDKPDIIVTCDPLNYFIRGKYINHPDHRAAGQATLDAVFPAAGNLLFFPELLDEGLRPHTPDEVWISLTQDPTDVLDVTDHWPIKVRALLAHKSQIGDPEKFLQRMAERRTLDSSDEEPRYEESFRRIIKR